MLRARNRTLIGALVAATTLTLAPAGTASAEGGMDLAAATRFTQHDAGTTVDDADVRIAMHRIGHDPGTDIGPGDKDVLIAWANRAKKVVDTALAQVGDPYRYGGSGPDSFDCSGLTSFAWRAAGKEIPRTSRDQANFTRSIARSELIPGDLVFNGSPVHHVSVYIGDGKVVDSPRSGYRVKVDERLLSRNDISKYGRVDWKS